jgi:ABC-2 type transport system permease protein
MRRILIVAGAEFSNAVRTKAFLIGMMLVPVLMGAAVFVQRRAEGALDRAERRFAIVDHTGTMVAALERAASDWNTSMGWGGDGKPAGPRFVPVPAPPGVSEEEVRLRLSERVRAGDLFAFVEIPADIVAIDTGATSRVRYHSNHPTYDTLPRWVQGVVNGVVLNQRFRAALVDPQMVARLSRAVTMDQLGLLERDATGTVKQAVEVDKVRTTGVPAALMFLLFIPVMTITPQLVNTVLEEKMSRISEVLLGSASPFELMMGKLLGAGSVLMVLAVSYVAVAYGVAAYYGYADAVSIGMLAGFVGFLALAVFLYGAMYIALGAACSNLKDAQSLMTPMILVTLIPAMTWMIVLRSPDSPTSVLLSLFPLATPFLMLLRLGLHPGPPAWQVLLSFVLTMATTIGVVWAAGKIFRTGLLMHGKTPTFAELVRWVRA